MIKRMLSALLVVLLLLGLCACGAEVGGTVKIHDTVEIPEDGWIEADIFRQIKDKAAVVTFTGESNGCRYEWTVFGEEIAAPEKLNLGVDVAETDGSVSLSFRAEEDFGFSPVLSVYLSDKWNALSATVYTPQKTVLCGASLTGSKATIVNFATLHQTGSCMILPDEENMSLAVPEIAAPTGTETDENEDIPAETLDPYLTPADNQGGKRVISDGKDKEQDKYLTDPIPEGKPRPVEPEDVTVGGKSYTCTFSIECGTILNNMADFNEDKLDVLPKDGVILKTTTVTFYENESVYDVLKRLCKEKGIHMSSRWTPIYNSAYVEGIHNLYEFDCGALSGWMYRVNGWYPNYGCSRYVLQQGDVVEWRFTCDLGADIGCEWLQGG